MFVNKNLVVSLALAVCLGFASSETWAGGGKGTASEEGHKIRSPLKTIRDLNEEFNEWDRHNATDPGALEVIHNLQLTDEDFQKYLGKNRVALPCPNIPAGLEGSKVRHFFASNWLRNKILTSQGNERCEFILTRLGFYKYSGRIKIQEIFRGVLSQLRSIILGEEDEKLIKVACIKYVDLVFNSKHSNRMLLETCWSVMNDHYKGKSGIKELMLATLILRHKCYPADWTKEEAVKYAHDILSKESASPVYKNDSPPAAASVTKKLKVNQEYNLKTMHDPILRAAKEGLLEKAKMKLEKLKAKDLPRDEVILYGSEEGDEQLYSNGESVDKSTKRSREDDELDVEEASPANSNHQSDDSLSLENPGVVEKKAKRTVYKGTKENKSEIRKALEERKLRMDRGESVQSYRQLAKSFGTTKTNLFRVEHRLGFRETTNALVEMDANRKIYNDYVTKEITHEEMINRFRKANNITLASANYLSLRFYELSKSTSKDKSDE